MNSAANTSSSSTSRPTQLLSTTSDRVAAQHVTPTISSSTSSLATSTKTPPICKTRGLGQEAKNLLTAWCERNEYRVPGKEQRAIFLADIHRIEGNSSAQDNQIYTFCKRLRATMKPSGAKVEADQNEKADLHLRTVYMMFPEFDYEDIKRCYLFFLANSNFTNDLAEFLVEVVNKPVDRVQLLNRYMKQIQEPIIRTITDGKLDAEHGDQLREERFRERSLSHQRDASVDIPLASIVNWQAPIIHNDDDEDEEDSPSVPHRILSPTGTDSTRATSIERSLSRASIKTIKMEEYNDDVKMDIIEEVNLDDEIQEISESAFLSGLSKASQKANRIRTPSVPPASPSISASPVSLHQPSPRRLDAFASPLESSSSTRHTGDQAMGSQVHQPPRMDFGTRIMPNESTVSFASTITSLGNIPTSNNQNSPTRVIPSVQYQASTSQPPPPRAPQFHQPSHHHTAHAPSSQIARYPPSAVQAFPNRDRAATPANQFLRRPSGNPPSQTSSYQQNSTPVRSNAYSTSLPSAASSSSNRPQRPQIAIPGSVHPPYPSLSHRPHTTIDSLATSSAPQNDARLQSAYPSLSNIPTGPRLLGQAISRASDLSSVMAASLATNPNSLGDARQRISIGSEKAQHLLDATQRGTFSNYGLSPRGQHGGGGRR